MADSSFQVAIVSRVGLNMFTEMESDDPGDQDELTPLFDPYRQK